MHSVVVYSRKGCHLCDVVKETLTRAQRHAEFEWRDVDIDTDPELQQEFNDQIPVVFIDGSKAFKYHMDEKIVGSAASYELGGWQRIDTTRPRTSDLSRRGFSGITPHRSSPGAHSP